MQDSDNIRLFREKIIDDCKEDEIEKRLQNQLNSIGLKITKVAGNLVNVPAKIQKKYSSKICPYKFSFF